MKIFVIVFCLFLSGCAVLVTPMIIARNQSYITDIAINDCKKFYDVSACNNLFYCILNSADISFTDKQLADYSSDVDYYNLAYKNNKLTLPMYYLWHPYEIVYNKNTPKRQADNRKKMNNFQIIQNTISRCYADNGFDVHKVLNSYKPQN